jgi:nucleotidyltransferase/DNA polymerase involved in DNA repair
MYAVVPMIKRLSISEFPLAVKYLHDTIAAQHDVLGLDIAVNDTRLMSGAQGRCNLNRNPGNFANAELRIQHSLSQSLALDVLCGHEVDGVCLADLVDGDDVWVI